MGEKLVLHSHCHFVGFLDGKKSQDFLPSLYGGIFLMGLNMLPAVEENLKFWASPTSRMGANTLPFSNARRQL